MNKKRFILCCSKFNSQTNKWLAVHEYEEGMNYIFCREFKTSKIAIGHARDMAIKKLAGMFVEVEAVGDYIKYNY